jgi:predicted MFS family arabinose efflux permease
MASALGIGRFIYTPILPPMAEGLLLTKGEAGLIASANFLGYLLGALAAASPRLPGSSRGWLLAALAVSAVTTGAMGWGGSLELFFGLRLAGGAASAFVLVFASALVLERLAATGRSNLAAVHFAGVGAGIALSAVLTWALAATDGGWRTMWFGGGLVSLAAVAGVALLVPAAQDAHAPKEQAAKTARSPRIWPLVVAYGLFGFGYVITATFIVAIVRGAPEVRSIEPVVWLVVGLAAIPSVGAWTAIGRRTGVLRAFAIACLVEAAGVAASVVWVSVPGLFVAAAFLGGTFMGITALGLIAARGLTAGDPRRALGLMTAAFGLGQIVGPAVAGYGFDLTGSFFLPSMLAAAGLCVAAALMALMRGK